MEGRGGGGDRRKFAPNNGNTAGARTNTKRRQLPYIPARHHCPTAKRHYELSGVPDQHTCELSSPPSDVDPGAPLVPKQALEQLLVGNRSGNRPFTTANTPTLTPEAVSATRLSPLDAAPLFPGFHVVGVFPAASFGIPDAEELLLEVSDRLDWRWRKFLWRGMGRGS